MIEKALELTSIQEEAKNAFLNMVKNGEIQLATFSSCPSCSSADFECFEESDRHGIPTQALICKCCGLIISSPHISESSLPEFYNKIYVPLNYKSTTRKQLFNSNQGESIFSYIEEFTAPAQKILDIGAGTGDVIHTLAKHLNDSEVMGIDYNEELVKGYKTTRNSRMLYGGIDDVLKINMKYDIIILSHVLEHIPNVNVFLSKLKQITTPASLVYIEVPGLHGFFRESQFYNFSFKKFHTIAHVYNFTYETLKRVLEHNGFEVLKADEKIRVVARLKSSTSACSSEYLRTRTFLHSTLPLIKKKYIEGLTPYLESRHARLDFPFKEISISSDLLKIKSQEEELKKLKPIAEEYLKFRSHPSLFILQKLVMRIKNKLRK